jgi:ankyrin repeat protein
MDHIGTNPQLPGMNSDELLAKDDAALELMTLVSKCKDVLRLQEHEKYFCLLDNNGDSVLRHAIKADNIVALGVIYASKHFHTIKGIQNKDGDYAVFVAAVEGKVDILRQLLSPPNNCRIMPPVCKEGGASSILHELIFAEKNSLKAVELLLDDLWNKDKYSYSEAEYIISFNGEFKEFGWIDPYSLALRLGREDIAKVLTTFFDTYHP